MRRQEPAHLTKRHMAKNTLSQFTISAVTNHRKLSSFKQHNLYHSSGGPESEMGLVELKLKAVFLLGLQGRIHPLPFPDSRGCLHSLVPDPIHRTAAFIVSPSLTLALLLPFCLPVQASTFSLQIWPSNCVHKRGLAG